MHRAYPVSGESEGGGSRIGLHRNLSGTAGI